MKTSPDPKQILRSKYLFESFIIKFAQSLNNDDRAAFRFWCFRIIPQGKLEIEKDAIEDSQIYRLIILLYNDNKLSPTDMSLLKAFLDNVKNLKLLDHLKQVEYSIAVEIILQGYFSITSENCFQPEGIYSDVVEYLVTIKEHNQELFTQPLEMLKQHGVHETLTVLRDEIQQLQSCRPQIPKNPATVIALLIILGDLYSNQDFTRQQLCFASEIIELLVQWMVKHCSLEALDDFVKSGKQRAAESKDVYELPLSIKESLKEIIMHISQRMDKQ